VILIVVAFLIQWPTFLTLLMAPVLIARYVRLAKEEEQELGYVFGDAYGRYRERVLGLWPWGRRRSAPEEEVLRR